MTTHLDIEPISDDNQKSLFRSQRLKISNKQSKTPFRVLEPSRFRSDFQFNTKAFGFNEIYKELDSEKVASLLKDPVAHDDFSRDLRNVATRGQANDFTVCMVKYKSTTSNPFPNQKEIELLTDIAYSYSDLTPLPMVEATLTDNNFSKYLEYAKKCIKTIEELNQKPIMGILPSDIARENYPKLLDCYINENINAFCFDFSGKTPNPLKLRPILRHLKQKKVLSDSLIYGINAKPGRPLKNTNVIPSKDFIAYGFGIDILGGSHSVPKRPKEFFEKMKLELNKKEANKKRLFIKKDYGYYKTDKKQEVESVFPNDTTISIEKILNDDNKIWQRLFNMEQQALEAGEVRKRLAELGKNETILDYIGTKVQIKKEIKLLLASHRAMSQSGLK